MKNLEEVAKELQEINNRLAALHTELVGREEAVRRRGPKHYRRWSPEEVERILMQADMAKELGRGALKTVLRRWNISTGHLYNWQRARAKKVEQFGPQPVRP